MTSAGTSIVARSSNRSQCASFASALMPSSRRALHGHVDGRVDVREAALHRVRPLVRRHPQHVLDVVLLEEQLHVARVLGVAGRLEGLDLGQLGLVHGRHQDLLGVRVVRRDAGHHVRDDQAAQVLLVGQGVLHGQDAAPGLAVEDEVAGVHAEGLADLLDLADEPVQVPQRRLLGLVAEPGPELVVVVVLDARVRQEAVARLQVLVRGARAAVQQEHLQAGVVADPLGPDAERALGGVSPGSSGRRRPARRPGPSSPGSCSLAPRLPSRRPPACRRAGRSPPGLPKIISIGRAGRAGRWLRSAGLPERADRLVSAGQPFRLDRAIRPPGCTLLAAPRPPSARGALARQSRAPGHGLGAVPGP